MSNLRFVLIAIVVFLVRFLLSILSPLVLLADIFITLCLAVFFLPNQKVNLGVFLVTMVLFDLISGDIFGLTTLSLLLTMLLIFLVKKVMLVSHRGFLANLTWLTTLYYFYLFIEQFVISRILFREPIFRINWSLLNLGGIVFWIAIMMILVKKFSHGSRTKWPLRV